jgi:solute carrier family 35 (UDP-galactose transporter), member B1
MNIMVPRSPRSRKTYQTVLSSIRLDIHPATAADIEDGACGCGNTPKNNGPAAGRFPRVNSTVSDITNMSDMSSDEDTGELLQQQDGVETVSSSLKPSNLNGLQDATKLGQLVFGAAGIYISYLYYGLVQEDLFRYRSPTTGAAFTQVWALQAVESSVTWGFGALGRSRRGSKARGLSPTLFLQAGGAQLLGKILMSLSLAAGLSFPVVVLAKSAKVLPVMLGQFMLGGSTYQIRDYLFAILIVSGTALVSVGSSSSSQTDVDVAAAGNNNKNSWTGITLIFLSLCADGLTGGLQKKLKRDTAAYQPNAFDFLYYSHMAQFAIASLICFLTGEVGSALTLLRHDNVHFDYQLLWYVTASCVCSAIGQIFIFYVIAAFDPLVCTTITTTRKMMSVMISILFKGHNLSGGGCLGLGLAVSALFMEMEGAFSAYRNKRGKKYHGHHDKRRSESAM